MKDREDYKAALIVVDSVVREWNPYSLLDGEKSDDEFDGEVAQLVTHIPLIFTPADAAQAISIVFSRAFGAESFSPADCAEPGQSLFEKLCSSGLLRQP